MEPERLSPPEVKVLGSVFLLLAVIYVVVMYSCWGTLSMAKVQAEYRECRELDKIYEATLQRREDVLYHIGASNQRGEGDQAAILERQLVKVEHDLDLLEERLQELDARRSGKRPKKLKE